MNRKPTNPARSSQRTPCERLSQRLEELAEQEGWSANTEKLELLGRTIFGDLWDVRPTPELKPGPSAPQPNHPV